MSITDTIVVLIIAILLFFGLSCQEKKDIAFQKRCNDKGMIVITGVGTRKYCGYGER